MSNSASHPTYRPRKSAYSVAETAALCGISRARFYELIAEGVMPTPVYCVRTRRPLYTADLAALCVRVRESNVGIDGRYVIFYQRWPSEPSPAAASAQRGRSAQRPAPPDPLAVEMAESLRAMGLRMSDGDLLAAIARQCPSGVREESYEADLRAVFDRLRRQEGV